MATHCRLYVDYVWPFGTRELFEMEMISGMEFIQNILFGQLYMYKNSLREKASEISPTRVILSPIFVTLSLN